MKLSGLFEAKITALNELESTAKRCGRIDSEKRSRVRRGAADRTTGNKSKLARTLFIFFQPIVISQTRRGAAPKLSIVILFGLFFNGSILPPCLLRRVELRCTTNHLFPFRQRHKHGCDTRLANDRASKGLSVSIGASR